MAVFAKGQKTQSTSLVYKIASCLLKKEAAPDISFGRKMRMLACPMQLIGLLDF